MIVRKIAAFLTLLVASALVQPLGAQTSQAHMWTSDRPDAKAPVSITEDRILPAGEFQIGVQVPLLRHERAGVRDRFAHRQPGLEAFSMLRPAKWSPRGSRWTCSGDLPSGSP